MAQFHPFSKLPAELREQILDASHPPNIFTITYDNDELDRRQDRERWAGYRENSRFICTLPNPTFLSLNQSIRDLALGNYKLLKSYRNEEGKPAAKNSSTLYIDKKKDILFLPKGYPEFILDQTAGGKNWKSVLPKFWGNSKTSASKYTTIPSS